MNVDVRIRTADLNDAFRTYIERRLHFALARFAGTLRRVLLQVEDVAGARRITDASCRIRAELLPDRRVLRQEEVDANLYVAIDLATERIGRSLGRVFERNRRFGTTREFYTSPST